MRRTVRVTERFISSQTTKVRFTKEFPDSDKGFQTPMERFHTECFQAPSEGFPLPNQAPSQSRRAPLLAAQADGLRDPRALDNLAIVELINLQALI